MPLEFIDLNSPLVVAGNLPPVATEKLWGKKIALNEAWKSAKDYNIEFEIWKFQIWNQ